MNDARFEQFLEKARPEHGAESYAEHPSQEVLETYVYNQLDGELLSRVSVHIATCGVCTRTVANLRRELVQIDTVFANYLQTAVTPELLHPSPARSPVLDQVVRIGWKAKEILSSSTRLSLIRVSTYAAATTVLLIAVNLILDRVLIPPVSPLASPEPVNRWWLHLYWLLVPFVILLLARGFQELREWRQKQRRNNREKK